MRRSLRHVIGVLAAIAPVVGCGTLLDESDPILTPPAATTPASSDDDGGGGGGETTSSSSGGGDASLQPSDGSTTTADTSPTTDAANDTGTSTTDTGPPPHVWVCSVPATQLTNGADNCQAARDAFDCSMNLGSPMTGEVCTGTEKQGTWCTLCKAVTGGGGKWSFTTRECSCP